MPRRLPGYAPAPRGKTLVGAEPLVFHCNYYNYFPQKTVLLDETLGMDEVRPAAAPRLAHHPTPPTSTSRRSSPRSLASISPATRRASSRGST